MASPHTDSEQLSSGRAAVPGDDPYERAKASGGSGKTCVLVADDESVTRKSLCHLFEDEGYRVVAARDGREAMNLMTAEVSVALLDLRMPEADGFECLDFIRKSYPDTQIIINTSNGDVSDAVLAMKKGAFEFVIKSFDSESLVSLVKQAVVTSHLSRDNRQLREAVSSPTPFSQMIAESASSQQLVEQAAVVAQLDSNILVTGESGTGKTTLARLIHQQGPRASGPLVSVNCASLPRDLIESELFGHTKGAFTGASNDRPGRIEMADGGTLFLDEIGDLPLELQPKLLTFLQDRTLQRLGSNKVIHVDVRIIVATHQDLATMCQEKRFREDLFFRLCVLTLHSPALRERREDIPALAHHFLSTLALRRSGVQIVLEPDALKRLQRHSWPGNIRELENVLERAAAFCENNTIGEDSIIYDTVALSAHDEEVTVAPATLANRTLAELEKQAILDTLSECNGNKAMAARNLGISEKSIYNKIKRHGLAVPINGALPVHGDPGGVAAPSTTHA